GHGAEFAVPAHRGAGDPGGGGIASAIGGGVGRGCLTTKETVMPATTIPVTATPEGDQFVGEAGFRDAYEQLLEHRRKTAPHLRSISVTFHPYCDDSCEEFVTFHAFSGAPSAERHAAAREWMTWAMAQLPYEVRRHFVLFAVSGETHAG